MATDTAERGEVVDVGPQRSAIVSLIERVNVNSVMTGYFVFIAIIVYLPMLSVIAFSFNSGGLSFPFAEFTLEPYRNLAARESMINATTRSLQLALVVTVITTVLATATALAYRFDFRGQRPLLFLLILGIIIPGITYGVGANLFFNEVLGLSKGLWLATPVHVVWTLPFAVIVLLAGFPPTLAANEEAARVMGAGRWTTFREIILPQITPTVLGAAVFAFTLSYNEGTRGLLLLGRQNTMPIEVFSIASGVAVEQWMFALGSFTTLLSTVLLIIAGALVIYGGEL